jgi:GT2 family glycosyltransferase
MVDKKNICTIVVTYGERFYLVKEVVNACLKSDLENFIIVDNGSPAKNAELLQNFAEMTKKATIKIIRLDQNYGSAGGYSKGIKTALNDSNNEYLFLLDDDNKIDLNTVNNLCSYWVEKATVGFKDKTALLALRSDRPYYREYISNPEPEKLIGSTNSFMHYDIFHTKFKKGLVLNHADKMEIRSPIAPYGGLFFHRDLISNIGLPEEKFFLYIDDIEFTYRITKSGGAIYIVPKTNIIDIDESWGNKKTDKHFISSTGIEYILNITKG